MPTSAAAPSQHPGAVRLFRVAGISVFLHWSWLLIAGIELRNRSGVYASQVWNVAEYLSVFGIVLLHEFGHAFACRSVGGQANRIILWPLGGIAYVDPPRRPGAQLWSIVAGPLVNVALVPITLLLTMFSAAIFPNASEDFQDYLAAVTTINIVLLVFNMLPIYPLDGGQIVRSILWYFVGEFRSLDIAATIGLVGAGAGMVFAITRADLWLMVLAFFAASRCWQGRKAAKAITAFLNRPRRQGPRCPACGESPLIGPFWRCRCGQTFDTFECDFTCPHCSLTHPITACPHCRAASPSAAWSPEHAYTQA